MQILWLRAFWPSMLLLIDGNSQEARYYYHSWCNECSLFVHPSLLVSCCCSAEWHVQQARLSQQHGRQWLRDVHWLCYQCIWCILRFKRDYYRYNTKQMQYWNYMSTATFCFIQWPSGTLPARLLATLVQSGMSLRLSVRQQEHQLENLPFQLLQMQSGAEMWL